MLNFYLDDYNLITVEKNEKLLNNSLKVFCKQKEISYSLKDNNDYLQLELNYSYQDQDELFVLLANETYSITPRFIVQTKRFEEEYKVDVYTLGSFVEKESTTFRLWSPLAKKAEVIIDNEINDLNYLGSGLYELKLNQNLDGHLYHYRVIRDKAYEFTDPFAYFGKDNNSYVIDHNKLLFNKVTPSACQDPIIYEINIRDFSSGDHLPFKYPGKLMALSEDNLSLIGQKIGLAYLKELGITHLQLMPIFKFDHDGYDYNWGYNPLAYNYLHQAYLVNEEPYAALKELAYVVATLHQANIRVNLDVVYNHFYKTYCSDLGQMLPYYFFRYEGDKLGNASYCGNETRSEAHFFRAYLKLLTKRWLELFDIDGLRFDLMGINDYQTINEITSELKQLKPDFLLYGEGWNMGNILPSVQRASLDNADKMKEVAFFNDAFRNNIRGKDFNDKECFLFGGGLFKEQAKRALSGQHPNLNYLQSLNYTECHDNYTLFDKALKLNHQYCKELSKLALALTVIARGRPFIHSGQEFLRTKNGYDNTYNLGDEINHLDWYRKNDNLDVVNYLRDLIKIRKSHAEFIKEDVTMEFADYYECLIYKLDNLCIFINPCLFDHIYNSEDIYEVFYDDSGFVNYEAKAFKIKAFSVLFAYKKM